MFGRWLACWALAIPTLGLSLLWFAAYRTRYFAERTVFVAPVDGAGLDPLRLQPASWSSNQ